MAEPEDWDSDGSGGGKGAADRRLGRAKGGRHGLGMELCSKARVWGSREESGSGLASELSS